MALTALAPVCRQRKRATTLRDLLARALAEIPAPV